MSQEVQDMFDRIARRYDRANRVLSLGIDKVWRRRAVRMANLAPGDKVMDAACGTGDLSFALLKAVRPGGAVVGVDFTPRMVELASAKADKRKNADGASFEEGDVMDLRFESDAFDAATISFGIRNVTEPVTGLREMARVVRPGGRVVVLEFGQPRGPWGAMYRFYSRFVMPPVGGLITGDRSAYEYLPRTAAAFPSGPAFVAMMEEAGLVDVAAKSLSGAIAWAYVGTVPDADA